MAGVIVLAAMAAGLFFAGLGYTISYFRHGKWHDVRNRGGRQKKRLVRAVVLAALWLVMTTVAAFAYTVATADQDATEQIEHRYHVQVVGVSTYNSTVSFNKNSVQCNGQIDHVDGQWALKLGSLHCFGPVPPPIDT